MVLNSVLVRFSKNNKNNKTNSSRSRPDVLIVESTYGTHIHEKREDRESRFTGLIHEIVNRGGRCLIPVFALGRAQELLLILGILAL